MNPRPLINQHVLAKVIKCQVCKDGFTQHKICAGNVSNFYLLWLKIDIYLSIGEVGVLNYKPRVSFNLNPSQNSLTSNYKHKQFRYTG